MTALNEGSTTYAVAAVADRGAALSEGGYNMPAKPPSARAATGSDRKRRQGSCTSVKENQGKSETAVVVGKAYDLALWLLPKLEKFPRSHRFTLGDRIAGLALDLLTTLVDASYARHKADRLARAGAQTNGLRYLLRLSKDLKLFPLESYGFAAERLEEIGRMIGGWRRSLEPET